MPLLGAHMSISGGLHLSLERLRQVDGDALQLFTKSERQWRSVPLSEEAVRLFRENWVECGKVPVAAHDSYLINLAALDPAILEKSVNAFAEELQRAGILGIPYLITHPGSHLGQGVEAGLERFVSNLDKAVERANAPEVAVLLETTAGQGTNLGSSFEEITHIIGSSRFSGSLGVCFDTCHAFAAGYDIRTAETYAETFRKFAEVVGFDRLKFFHLNDSKKGLGARVDRHEHIGEGELGLAAFRHLLNDSRFSGHPMVLETPKENGLEKDRENLKVLRSLIETSA
ncbi:MAG: deoxyribonuclease IV [Syntrophobacteraceae bacterium]|nr:deoxyribonuclease IV [Desulfobacteraceae bacterium]